MVAFGSEFPLESEWKDISMAKTDAPDLVLEFDVVSEEVLELVDAGLPKGRSSGGEHSPEGWDSKHIIAHIAELCNFWRFDIERGLSKPRTAIVGRSALDSDRDRRVEELAVLPTAELIEQLSVEIGKTAGLLAALEPSDLDVMITHLCDGKMSVAELISKHLIAHLGEHLVQLKELEQNPPSI